MTCSSLILQARTTKQTRKMLRRRRATRLFWTKNEKLGRYLISLCLYLLFPLTSMKTVRSRTERAIQGAAQRQRITFNPHASNTASSAVVPATDSDASRLTKAKTKQRRRVSMGVAVDAETGETVDLPQTEEEEATPVVKKRQSRRQSTIQNTSQTFSRVQESETRKVDRRTEAGYLRH